MRKYIAASCALVLMVATSLLDAGTIYKCKDEKGKIFFSDRQCTGDQTQTEVRIKRALSPASDDASRDRDLGLQERSRLADERIEKSRAKREREAQARKAKRVAKCNQEKDLLAKLEQYECGSDGLCRFYALVKTDEEGNTVTLSENAKQAEIKRLRKIIAKEC